MQLSLDWSGPTDIEVKESGHGGFKHHTQSQMQRAEKSLPSLPKQSEATVESGQQESDFRRDLLDLQAVSSKLWCATYSVHTSFTPDRAFWANCNATQCA
jgi:hypothetical protein